MCEETVENLGEDEVRKRFDSAIAALMDADRDRDLLVMDVNERSISHKLAEHLAREFDEWDVDCEYN